MRIQNLTKAFSGVAAAIVVLVITVPGYAQQHAGSYNDRIGTIGDIAANKLKPAIRKMMGLNFSTLGLFGDAEVYPDYNPPTPFIFALPDFGATQDFSNWTFQDYMHYVAASYDLKHISDYQSMFRYQNEMSFFGDPLFQRYDSMIADFDQQYSDLNSRYQYYFDYFNEFPVEFQQQIYAQYQSDYNAILSDLESQAFLRIHQDDFMAGGGFIELDKIAKPVLPQSEEPIWTPLPVPDETVVTDTSDDAASNTNSAVAMANQIAQDIEDGNPIDIEAIAAQATSASQSASQAAAVAAVPEPATLGLLTLGSTMLLTRSRKY